MSFYSLLRKLGKREGRKEGRRGSQCSEGEVTFPTSSRANGGDCVWLAHNLGSPLGPADHSSCSLGDPINQVLSPRLGSGSLGRVMPIQLVCGLPSFWGLAWWASCLMSASMGEGQVGPLLPPNAGFLWHLYYGWIIHTVAQSVWNQWAMSILILYHLLKLSPKYSSCVTCKLVIPHFTDSWFK
jgi:hypothetical protein